MYGNLFLSWKKENSWKVGNKLFPKVSNYSHSNTFVCPSILYCLNDASIFCLLCYNLTHCRPSLTHFKM